MTTRDITASKIAGPILKAQTIAALRGFTGQFAGQRAYCLGREYIWVTDIDWPEENTDAVIIPAGHTGAGRWLYRPQIGRPNTLHALPRLGKAMLDMSADTEYRVMLLGDSVSAKYTTSPAGANFGTWMRDLFWQRENRYLELANAITTVGGALGSALTLADDATVSVIGYHWAMTDGDRMRMRTGGSDPQTDSVVVPYIQEPGAGSLTVNITAYTTGETVAVTVDADGPRMSKTVTATLSGQVTGVGPGKRAYVDIEAGGGPVKVLPWVEAKDSTLPGVKLAYNQLSARGGFNFNPDNFETHDDVLVQQIIDNAPDLILVEYLDPGFPAARAFIDNLIAECNAREFYPDWLLVGSPQGTNTESINGVATSRSRLVAEMFKTLSETYPNVWFHDHGAVVRSLDYGQEIGAYTELDTAHPQNSGNAAMIAELVRCIPTHDFVKGVRYGLEQMTQRLKIISTTNYDPDNRKTYGEMTAAAAGDVDVEWVRNWNFVNWFNGSAETVMKVDRFGATVKELRFLGSNVRLQSTADNVLAVGSTLSGVVYGGSPGDAVIMSSITASATAADLASAAATINTTQKFAGKLVWDTTNSKLARASAPGPTTDWNYVDGSGSISPT